MTNASEKRMAAHRGITQAEPASRSRLAALDRHGLAYARIDDLTVLVEDRFVLNLALSSWRSLGGDGCHGYLVSTLAAEIKQRSSEKPVAGRDSTAPKLTFPTTMGSDAESATGPVSKSVLPSTVWP